MVSTLSIPSSRPPRRRCRFSPGGEPQQALGAAAQTVQSEVECYLGNVSLNPWLVYASMVTGETVEVPVVGCEGCGRSPLTVFDAAGLARIVVSHRFGARMAVPAVLVMVIEAAIAGGGEWRITTRRVDAAMTGGAL